MPIYTSTVAIFVLQCWGLCMTRHASSWSNRLLQTLESSHLENEKIGKVNPNDPKLKDNDKPSYKSTCDFWPRLVVYVPGAYPRETLPKRKAWSSHSDRGDCVGLRAKLLTALGHPLSLVPGPFKQELNKLKQALQPVNFRGRLLLQLGKSLQCDTAHLWWAAGKSSHTVFSGVQPLITQLPGSAGVVFSREKDRSIFVSLSKKCCTLEMFNLLSAKLLEIRASKLTPQHFTLCSSTLRNTQTPIIFMQLHKYSYVSFQKLTYLLQSSCTITTVSPTSIL